MGGRRTKKRPYQVRLLELDDSGKIGNTIASRDFNAVDEVGAKRAAAHWYKGLYPKARVAGAHTSWEVQSATIEQPEFHYCTTHHGLLAVHATDGKDEAQAKMEEEVAEADETEIMQRIMADPEAVKKQFRGRMPVLLGILENYFIYHNPCIGSLRDEGLLEADLIFDWTGAPQMLARAWRVEPKFVRYKLHKLAVVECPFCGKQIEFKPDRIPGGFEFTFANTPCPVCKTALIEINCDALSVVSTKWRTPQSPFWIPPNHEQARDWSIKRFMRALDDPQRYFIVGSVKDKDRNYYTFIDQCIRKVQPGARVVRYSAPETKGGAEARMRVFFKEWSVFLGGDGLNNTKQREAWCYEKIKGAADWLIIDRMEYMGDDLQRRLRGLDRNWPHWNEIPMVWIWNNGKYYCTCLRGQRKFHDWSPLQNENKNSSPQILWLPDPEQLEL